MGFNSNLLKADRSAAVVEDPAAAYRCANVLRLVLRTQPRSGFDPAI